MRNKFLAIALFVIGSTVATFAQNTPVVNAREHNQKERIKEGVQSGELTKPEAKKLVKQQRNIRKTEAKAKADGTVTSEERTKLDRKQDRANRNIAKQKHDKQDRH
jgi:hypothetical protein